MAEELFLDLQDPAISFFDPHPRDGRVLVLVSSMSGGPIGGNGGGGGGILIVVGRRRE
jgi:hypothetical protein